MPTIESMQVYPIKGAAGVNFGGRDRVAVTPNGLEHDRQFMVVDAEGRFVSQRRFGKLAIVKTAITSTGVVASAEGMEELTIPFKQDGRETLQNRASVDMFDIIPKVWGYDVGPEAGEWFSEYLKQDGMRVLAAPSRVGRLVNPRYHLPTASNRVAFADGFSMLLASSASLAQLNERLGPDRAVPMNRFRPNIVVGEDLDPETEEDLAPFAEDEWKVLRAGKLSMFVVRACGRCKVINIDQETGEQAGGVLKALSEFRLGKDLTRPEPNNRRETFFGQNVTVRYLEGATLRVGDNMEVVERGDPNIELEQAA